MTAQTTIDRSLLIAGLVCLAPAAAWAGSAAPLMPSAILFANLWLLAVYDWRTFRLPNLFTLTLVLTGGLYIYMGTPYPVAQHLIGALVGLLFFPALNFLYRLIRGRDGIGLGDAKLLCGVGLWLGWMALPFVLLVASLAGLGYGILTIGRQKQPIATARIPFGPFLCLGAWLVWLYLQP